MLHKDLIVMRGAIVGLLRPFGEQQIPSKFSFECDVRLAHYATMADPTLQSAGRGACHHDRIMKASFAYAAPVGTFSRV
jgi:hypothetical protein